jgi:hypothetical protein
MWWSAVLLVHKYNESLLIVSNGSLEDASLKSLPHHGHHVLFMNGGWQELEHEE